MKKTIYRLLLAVCIIVFLVSAFMIGKHFYEQYRSQADFKQLTQFIESAELEETVSMAPDKNEVKLNAYQKLKVKNEDFVGWISIPGTKINYPVMQTVTDPEFYLRRNFEKEDSQHGTPFIDYRNDLTNPSDNIIIYGHHMKDGTMFADLIQYSEFSFYQNHPNVYFDTVKEQGEYQIVSVFKTPSYGDNVFMYHNYIDFQSQEEFDEYYQEVQNRSLYDTGVPLAFGDKFITLSTCEYSLEDDGRFVVLAKKIS